MEQQLTTEQLERIKDFVAALRSGDYAQTTWRLARRNEDGVKSYCCEGVAFARYYEQFENFKLNWVKLPSDDIITMEAHWLDVDGTWRVDRNVAPRPFWQAMGMCVGASEGLVFELPDQLELRDHDDEYRIGYATLNDDGFTFDQIADLIEWQFIPVDQREVKA